MIEGYLVAIENLFILSLAPIPILVIVKAIKLIVSSLHH